MSSSNRAEKAEEARLAKVAQTLGMKRSEVIAVTDVDAGTVVTTFDGQRTLIAGDGTLTPYDGPAPAADAADRAVTATGRPRAGRRPKPGTPSGGESGGEPELSDEERAAAERARLQDEHRARQEVAGQLGDEPTGDTTPPAEDSGTTR